MKESFPRLLRILNGPDYQRVFKAKRIVHSRYFVLYHTPGEDDHSRIGIIASRKSLRYAVWRNRYKRLVRETFRTHSIRTAGIDIVLIGKSALKGASNIELVDCLNRLFIKLQHGTK